MNQRRPELLGEPADLESVGQYPQRILGRRWKPVEFTPGNFEIGFKPPASREYDRPPTGHGDGSSDLDCREFRSTGIEIGDDLHYGRPVCRHDVNLAL
jgi:hypothetical protein